jgi:hypothetical protein
VSVPPWATLRSTTQRFLTKLDVVFANLYFAALAAASTDIGAAPSAWRPLLQARNTPGIARIQFALAGMNAHINRDLPDGLVQSFLALGGNPITDELREKDFDSVNDILERVEQEVKTEFSVGLVGDIDRLGGPVDDAVAIWKVRAARSAAWTNAQVLWGLRSLPQLRDRFFSKLDSLVGMTGRGLLLPRHPTSGSRWRRSGARWPHAVILHPMVRALHRRLRTYLENRFRSLDMLVRREFQPACRPVSIWRAASSLPARVPLPSLVEVQVHGATGRTWR